MTPLPPSPFISSGGPQEAPAVVPQYPTTTAGLWDEYQRDQRLRALYDALDPPQPPLFLRRPSILDYRPDPSLAHILKVFFAMEA